MKEICDNCGTEILIEDANTDGGDILCYDCFVERDELIGKTVKLEFEIVDRIELPSHGDVFFVRFRPDIAHWLDRKTILDALAGG